MAATDSDTFVFDAALGKSTNVDAILGLRGAKLDEIALAQASCTPTSMPISHDIGRSSTSRPSSIVGTKAHDQSDRIIYNASNGKLFYDHDGHGGRHGADKVLIASPRNPGPKTFGPLAFGPR